MLVAEWRARQRQIPRAAPGLLYRNQWILGWFRPSFLLRPKNRSTSHKTAGYHRHPPFLSGCPLSPGTKEEEVGRVSASEKNCKCNQCLSFYILYWVNCNWSDYYKDYYLGVVQLSNGWVWVQVGPHKRGYDVDTGGRGWSLRQSLRFGGQATPTTFEAVCANN